MNRKIKIQRKGPEGSITFHEVEPFAMIIWKVGSLRVRVALHWLPDVAGQFVMTDIRSGNRIGLASPSRAVYLESKAGKEDRIERARQALAAIIERTGIERICTVLMAANPIPKECNP